jgi:hypothetical protein
VSQSPQSVARERIAQTRTVGEWVDMINDFWGRRVVTSKHDKKIDAFVIASVLGAWPNGFPPKK